MTSSKVRSHPANSRITVPSLISRKTTREKITALTAYDVGMARILDNAGVDIILVGDSVANVVQGHDTTLPVTLEEMIYHCRCVSRGVSRALVVGDMPFLSYQVSTEGALLSAGRLIKEGGVSSVKLEGGVAVAPIVAAMSRMDIQVMGHIGMTPQSYHRMGGYRVQGRSEPERILDDALALEEAGAFAIVIEGVPEELATKITERVSIPTIGIGAGVGCDGQILVSHDMLGMHDGTLPIFVRKYLDAHSLFVEAVSHYVADVKEGSFPSAEFSYGERKRHAV